MKEKLTIRHSSATDAEPTAEITIGPANIQGMRFLVFDGKVFEWDPTSTSWRPAYSSQMS
jgi:hypothetical protein